MKYYVRVRPFGKAIASGHHMAEEAPEEVTAELRYFLSQENI
jgi:haloacetate dehalogenase